MWETSARLDQMRPGCWRPCRKSRRSPHWATSFRPTSIRIRARLSGRDGFEASADEARRTLIAVSGVEPVGAALVSAEWLDGLYVVPERWGSGLADELHDRALALVQGLGSAKCHLWVLEHNARARCFYERRGWHENGRTRVVEYPPNPLDVGYTLDF
jgi:GNAT superfamily N-acetyltransferase